VKEQLATTSNRARVIVATGRYIGEGFDDARLDTLFLALPMSWKGTLVQYAGRLHRLHPGKTDVRIFDYVDRDVPMLLRMFEKRLRGYRAIGYSEGEAVPSYAAKGDEYVAQGPRPRDSALDSEPLNTATDAGSRFDETSPGLNETDLEQMVKEATVDCYGAAEQATGLFIMIQDSLELPFDTTIDRATMTVQRVDLGSRDEIVAIGTRNGERHTLPINEVSLPSPPPLGAEWIVAYRHWLGGA